MNRLPIIYYEGKQWFFDERLKQFRNVKNPHDYVDLFENENLYWYMYWLSRQPGKGKHDQAQ